MVHPDASPSGDFEESEGSERYGVRRGNFSELDKARYRWLIRIVFAVSILVLWNEFSSSKGVKRIQADYPTALMTSFQSLNCSWSSGPSESSRTSVDDMLFFIDSVFFQRFGLLYTLKGETLRASYQHRPSWTYTYTIYVVYTPHLSIRGLEKQLGELVRQTPYEIFMTSDSRSIPGLYRFKMRQRDMPEYSIIMDFLPADRYHHPLISRSVAIKPAGSRLVYSSASSANEYARRWIGYKAFATVCRHVKVPPLCVGVIGLLLFRCYVTSTETNCFERAPLIGYLTLHFGSTQGEDPPLHADPIIENLQPLQADMNVSFLQSVKPWNVQDSLRCLIPYVCTPSRYHGEISVVITSVSLGLLILLVCCHGELPAALLLSIILLVRNRQRTFMRHSRKCSSVTRVDTTFLVLLALVGAGSYYMYQRLSMYRMPWVAWETMISLASLHFTYFFNSNKFPALVWVLKSCKALVLPHAARRCIDGLDLMLGLSTFSSFVLKKYHGAKVAAKVLVMCCGSGCILMLVMIVSSIFFGLSTC
ncbi:hypothetical protein GUITHDRAFT_131423 [Guillardia theta CCMP2712]|uniref:Uncharacterized protein n=1 Tax=Guillardia theta (strain CCMP2712) TaxID=905079 RepID=L1K3H5_GUITC|nr:hypothetical protein GUITHDRAFT_131423 [Guillardia theta CCMP2712]EKX55159.1 hypothetical protein GUITHDRAFT_131423 [Guillardia theta CCMP2712]|eukprot:XP_005842139.1 hypothetical protein GUITHDRAFT_131423 [Guillardia theta CCMP2712]